MADGRNGPGRNITRVTWVTGLLIIGGTGTAGSCWAAGSLAFELRPTRGRVTAVGSYIFVYLCLGVLTATATFASEASDT